MMTYSFCCCKYSSAVLCSLPCLASAVLLVRFFCTVLLNFNQLDLLWEFSFPGFFFPLAEGEVAVGSRWEKNKVGSMASCSYKLSTDDTDMFWVAKWRVTGKK